jgi:hypothetical protein
LSKEDEREEDSQPSRRSKFHEFKWEWVEKGIPNSELQLEHIPHPICWGSFSATFNGYKWAERVFGDFGKGIKFANSWLQKWLTDKTLPPTLSELRACLFFEGRRDHWVYSDEDRPEEMEAYCRALIEAIREKVMRDERD